MSHVLGTTGPTKVEANDRTSKAWRAVQRFRELLPVLNAYARHLTGRPEVRIELSPTSNGRTNGTIIYLRPPLALGESLSHALQNCNKRDENKKQICPACHQRESVLIVIYHEIAHIVGDSFVKPQSSDIEKIFKDAVRASGTKAAERAKAQLEKHEWTSYVEMANVLNEWLGFVVNVLEDARIDHEMFRSLPGTKPMYQAMLNQLKVEGIEIPGENENEPKYLYWHEQPLNGQAIFALYFLYSQYSAEGWFHEDINKVLEDETIREYIEQSRSSESIADVYRLAFPVLERLRELGFCQLPEDAEEDSGSQPEQNDQEQGADGQEDDKKNETQDPSESDSSGDAGDSDDDSGSSSESSESSDPSGSDKDGSSQDGESEDPGDDGTGDDSSSGTRGSGSADDSSPAQEGDEEVDEDNQSGDGDEVGPPVDGGSPELQGSSNSPASDDGATPEDVTGGESNARPEPGTPAQVRVLILRGGGHDREPTEILAPDAQKESNDEDYYDDEDDDDWYGDDEDKDDSANPDDKAVIIAIIQGQFFDQPSRNVTGVRIHTYPSAAYGWRSDPSDISTSEGILGSALMRMRVAFTENATRGIQRDLKSGRVSGRKLARRAPFDDPRMFQKRARVSKRDYFVLIGLDISGSTAGWGGNAPIEMIKQAAAAQATLCHRLGVKFAVYAHTGDSSYNGDMTFEIYTIKTPEEPWNQNTQQRLAKLAPTSGNLDGHTLEYYRKVLDRRGETDRILMYYTDGQMPAMNYEEELAILQREIATCNSRGYTLMGVGVRNDDSSKHGLDTVRLDQIEDVTRVVEHLEKRLRG